MKNLKFEELAGYACAFVSFVLPKVLGVKEIILFGSATRGEADKNSDIDLFFDIEKKEEEKVKNILNAEIKKFYKTKLAEIWFLKGVDNPISVHVGELKKWKLKRSIISEGISLYGKYKEIPEKMKCFVYFYVEPIKTISKRNKVIRVLFGRKEKNYGLKGFIEKFLGRKLSPASFLIPNEHAGKIIEFLGKEKIKFRFFEFWTDQIQ